MHIYLDYLRLKLYHIRESLRTDLNGERRLPFFINFIPFAAINGIA